MRAAGVEARLVPGGHLYGADGDAAREHLAGRDPSRDVASEAQPDVVALRADGVRRPEEPFGGVAELGEVGAVRDGDRPVGGEGGHGGPQAEQRETEVRVVQGRAGGAEADLVAVAQDAPEAEDRVRGATA